MPRTLINIATYNEIENLPNLLREVWQHAEDADILVVDDNSPDGTGQWCDQAAAGEPRLACLHRPGKLGLGSATIAAYQWAIEQDYDLLLTMDADFSHPPRFVPDLLAAMTPNVDLAIGSRYVDGGSIDNWPLYRRLSSRAINGYARWMLGLSPRDCSGAFRCHRVAVLQRLDFAEMHADGYAFYEESIWHFQRSGAGIVEVPFAFVDRTQGRSKIGFREALRAVVQIAKSRRRSDHRVNSPADVVGADLDS